MDPAFHRRALGYGVVGFAMLPPAEYADLLAETRRTGTCTSEFHSDGVCTFELRDGDLYLRTARGELKAAFSLDSYFTAGQPGDLSITPLGRFLEYCHDAGVTMDQAMHFHNALNNEALLDCVVACTFPDERNACFIYVTQLSAGMHLRDQNVMLSVGVPFASCASSHAVFVALVRRRDVDIGRLVKKLRRARSTETMRLLEQPDMADAEIARIISQLPGTLPRAATPRKRFDLYVTPYGVTNADAAAFADALDDDDRLDATVLSTNKDGTSFYVLVHDAVLVQQPQPFLSNICRLPDRLRAATRLALFDTDADLRAEAARLRRADPFNMRNMLAAMPGKLREEVSFGNQQPVRSAIAADRACVACGWHAAPGGAAAERKLMACAACRLVLYCCKECQTNHWKEHKKACKAARDVARTGK